MKETFGQRFQRLRKQHNLTQEEVAAKVNISAQAVSKWENDIHKLSRYLSEMALF